MNLFIRKDEKKLKKGKRKAKKRGKRRKKEWMEIHFGRGFCKRLAWICFWLVATFSGVFAREPTLVASSQVPACQSGVRNEVWYHRQDTRRRTVWASTSHFVRNCARFSCGQPGQQRPSQEAGFADTGLESGREEEIRVKEGSQGSSILQALGATKVCWGANAWIEFKERIWSFIERFHSRSSWFATIFKVFFGFFFSVQHFKYLSVLIVGPHCRSSLSGRLVLDWFCTIGCRACDSVEGSLCFTSLWSTHYRNFWWPIQILYNQFKHLSVKHSRTWILVAICNCLHWLVMVFQLCYMKKKLRMQVTWHGVLLCYSDSRQKKTCRDGLQSAVFLKMFISVMDFKSKFIASDNRFQISARLISFQLSEHKENSCNRGIGRMRLHSQPKPLTRDKGHLPISATTT